MMHGNSVNDNTSFSFSDGGKTHGWDRLHQWYHNIWREARWDRHWNCFFVVRYDLITSFDKSVCWYTLMAIMVIMVWWWLGP